MSSKSEEHKLLQSIMKLQRAAFNAEAYGIVDPHPLKSPNTRAKGNLSDTILRAVVPNTPDNIRRVKMIHVKNGWSFVIYGRGPWKLMDHWFSQKGMKYLDRPPTKECPYVAIYQKENWGYTGIRH
jgi:hypothetical protein